MRAALLSAVLLLLALPSIAEACTVCGAGADNKGAFIGMTAFLTLLPLGFIGGVIYWLRSRAVALAAMDDVL